MGAPGECSLTERNGPLDGSLRRVRVFWRIVAARAAPLPPRNAPLGASVGLDRHALAVWMVRLRLAARKRPRVGETPRRGLAERAHAASGEGPKGGGAVARSGGHELPSLDKGNADEAVVAHAPPVPKPQPFAAQWGAPGDVVGSGCE